MPRGEHEEGQHPEGVHVTGQGGRAAHDVLGTEEVRHTEVVDGGTARGRRAEDENEQVVGEHELTRLPVPEATHARPRPLTQGVEARHTWQLGQHPLPVPAAAATFVTTRAGAAVARSTITSALRSARTAGSHQTI